MKHQSTLGVTFLLAMTVAACGGGSGGSNSEGDNVTVTAKAPTEPVTITNNNSGAVADESVNSFDNLSTSSSNTNNASILPVSGNTRKINVNDIVNTVTTTYQQQLTGTLAAAAISCVTGSGVKPDGFDAFPVTITWNNCFDGEDTINGSVTINGSGDFNTTFNGSFSFNNFSYSSSSDNFGLHGNVSISFSVSGSTTSGSFSSDIVQLTIGSEITDITNLNMTFSEVDFGDETLTMNYTVNSTRIGGSVRLSTVTPIKTHFGSDYPYTGQVLIEGANGTRIRVTALSDSLVSTSAVQIEVDTGSGYGTPKLLSWATFDSGVF